MASSKFRSVLQRVLLASIFFLPFTKAFADTEVRAVPSIDVQKFAGTWNEIASIPQFFQRDCVATNATYTPLPNGELDVYNQCRNKTLDGDLRTIHGKAWAPDKTSNAKLKVQFFWPISADYWVIDIDPNYQWAVTASPNHDYLWILSRTRSMPDDLYNKLLDDAKAQGFDVTQLKKTLQPAD